MDVADLLAETRGRYYEALALGQPGMAQSVIDRALSRGASRAEIYLHVLAPCQARIGECWHRGAIGIAEEHLATTITMGVMDFLKRGMEQGPDNGFRALVTPVEGDRHTIGARFVADFLEMDGWEVDCFGNDTPAGDLGEFVRQRGYDLVALSSTLPECLPNVAATTRAIRSQDEPTPKILLGGRALEGQRLDPAVLGCDATAGNPLEAVKEARRLVGVTDGRLTLQEYLALLGGRVRAIRKRHRMTQQELGDVSGLDRTYISAVEQGKQNLTVGALRKIAHALDMPMGELLASR
ncbi:MAG: helix-turn-helix domain-containing protein [Dehalococcoidia bacterium]|nr:helix-turn-helix domain-containing protein [Dehalococcoidia bacterium]